MAASPSQPSGRSGSDIRIGPITIFAFVIILCMAVLAVLAFSTAHASMVMTQRQATAMSELYLDETAAQTFLADLDDELSYARSSGSAQSASAIAARITDSTLASLCQSARSATDNQVTAYASVEGTRLNAEFTCENGRVLYITATILDDATYRIDKWKMTAVTNEAEPAGNLWTGE